MTTAPDRLLAQADTLAERGLHAAAVRLYDRSLATTEIPAYRVVALVNRGISREALGDLNGAVADWLAAERTRPGYAPALANRARVALALGDAPTAWRLTGELLAHQAADEGVLITRVRAARVLGCAAEGVVAADVLLALRPDLAEVHGMRGLMLQDAGDGEGAVAALRQALACDDPPTWTWINLGALLYRLDRPTDARPVLEEAVARAPEDGLAWANLGAVMMELGDLATAEAQCRQATTVAPETAQGWDTLGLVLQAQGRRQEALAAHERAHALAPDNPAIQLNLGAACHQMRQLTRAEPLLTPLVSHPLLGARASVTLAGTLGQMGRPQEAVTLLCRAVAMVEGPEQLRLLSNILFWHQYAGVAPPETTRAVREHWAALAADPNPVVRPRPRGGRPLRVGYFSYDLEHDVLARFLDGLLAVHDRTRVTPLLYSGQPTRQGWIARLERHTPVASFAALPVESVVAQLRADALDVLVEVTGHSGTPQSRLLGRRSAPVQVHYLGYWGSVGGRELDYWIGDDVLLPESEQEWFHETLWRLPRCWLAWAPHDEVAAVTPAPAEDDAVVLASYNQVAKLTPRTWDLWATILHRLPRARLRLKASALLDEGVQAWALAELARRGVARERVEIIDMYPDWQGHMASWGTVDMALDPVGGVTGGTTTLEALWMGVPVITRRGDHAAQRMSASMLTALGRPEWIADTDEAYVETVVTLARDPAARRAARATQREAMAASPLCDQRGMARALEDAFAAIVDRAAERES